MRPVYDAPVKVMTWRELEPSFHRNEKRKPWALMPLSMKDVQAVKSYGGKKRAIYH